MIGKHVGAYISPCTLDLQDMNRASAMVAAGAPRVTRSDVIAVTLRDITHVAPRTNELRVALRVLETDGQGLRVVGPIKLCVAWWSSMAMGELHISLSYDVGIDVPAPLISRSRRRCRA